MAHPAEGLARQSPTGAASARAKPTPSGDKEPSPCPCGSTARTRACEVPICRRRLLTMPQVSGAALRALPLRPRWHPGAPRQAPCVATSASGGNRLACHRRLSTHDAPGIEERRRYERGRLACARSKCLAGGSPMPMPPAFRTPIQCPPSRALRRQRDGAEDRDGRADGERLPFASAIAASGSRGTILGMAPSDAGSFCNLLPNA